MDGVYHDSHSLEGGTAGVYDATSLTFDSYSDYLFVKYGNTVPVYDLSDGTYQFDNARWPDYANFSGSKYIFVRFLGATTTSYISFDMYDYGGGAAIATFRTDTGIASTYSHNGKTYTVTDSRNIDYYFRNSTIYLLVEYVNYSAPAQGGNTSIVVKYEVPFTDSGFSAAADAFVLKTYNTIYFAIRGYNPSNGYFTTDIKIDDGSGNIFTNKKIRLYDSDYNYFHERTWVNLDGDFQYPHSKILAYSAILAYGTAKKYSFNLTSNVKTTISSLPYPGTYIDRMLGMLFTSGTIITTISNPYNYASDSDLTYPTILRLLSSNNSPYYYKALINGSWVTYAAGVDVGLVYFEKNGWNYAIHKDGTAQKIKRLKNDMTSLEDFITL